MHAAPPPPLTQHAAHGNLLRAPNAPQAEVFEDMIAALMLCCAGLASYLIDSYPDNLPEYDPL